jgi:DNA-binding transcriptional regulator YiaG
MFPTFRLYDSDFPTMNDQPELRSEIERLRKALEAIAAPFPAVIGPAEDMLEDWMSAANRMKATAREALGL